MQRGNKVPACATPSKDNEFTEIKRKNKAPRASPETSRNEESFQRVERKRHKQQVEKSRFATSNPFALPTACHHPEHVEAPRLGYVASPKKEDPATS